MSRYTISAATVVMLVVLRLVIGWHFFHEGISHLTDPRWTSEKFLREAKGPLAPMYHAYLDDFHEMDRWLHSDDDDNSEANAVTGWIDEIQGDGKERLEEFSLHYQLNDKQKKDAEKELAEFQARIRSWAAGNGDELKTHVHEWRRRETARQAEESHDVPFHKSRLSEKLAKLNSETRGWQSEVASIEQDYVNDLAKLLSAEQRGSGGAAPAGGGSLESVDGVMKYAILAIGALLLLGLFTRTACVAGAAFLFSIVLTQPFWIRDVQPTFNQYVEMFALLTLATTHVGRWGGVDFFVHHLLFGRDSAKGTFDASES